MFTKLDAKVDMRIYPRMGHTVNQDEIVQVRNCPMNEGLGALVLAAHEAISNISLATR